MKKLLKINKSSENLTKQMTDFLPEELVDDRELEVDSLKLPNED